MNGDSQDDDSDRDHAQEGQEPVGQSMKSLVTRGRQKEKKCGSKPYDPTVQCGEPDHLTASSAVM